MKSKNNKKCILLFSGGLDSRLALKIMQSQGFEVTSLYFKLPFSCSNFEDVEEFLKSNKSKLVVFDCNKGKLFEEYWESISNAKYGRGQSVNPCKDCKIFMFEHAKKYADKNNIELVVTGEVLGERPMSQKENSMSLIEKKTGLKGRLLRPLSAKLLSETIYEEKGIIDRNKLYDIKGRRREKQIKLAKKFNIKFPSPAGGCLLCEILFEKRFNYAFKRGLNQKEIPLINFGRHFVINDSWIILGRNYEENKFLNKFKLKNKKLKNTLFRSEDLNVLGPDALVFKGKVSDKVVKDLIFAYSKKGNLKLRKKFEKYKL